jgi:hypothetical protein
MKKSVIYSYLRHLVLLAYLGALAYTKGKGVAITHFSKGEFAWAAQSVWLSVLPQLRHAVAPAIDLYLKKRYPGLEVLLKDIKATPTV